MSSLEQFVERRRREVEHEAEALQARARGMTKRLVAVGQEELDKIRRGVLPREGRSPGDTASKAGDAVGWGGVAHDAVGAAGKAATRDAAVAKALDRGFRPLSRGLGAVSAGLTAIGSRQDGDPLDVTIIKAGSPAIHGFLGGVAGGTAGAVAGEFIFPPGGALIGAPIGAVTGGVAGSEYGEWLADNYARARTARPRTSPR